MMHITITSFHINLCADKNYPAPTPRLYWHPKFKILENMANATPDLWLPSVCFWASPPRGQKFNLFTTGVLERHVKGPCARQRRGFEPNPVPFHCDFSTLNSTPSSRHVARIVSLGGGIFSVCGADIFRVLLYYYGLLALSTVSVTEYTNIAVIK